MTGLASTWKKDGDWPLILNPPYDLSSGERKKALLASLFGNPPEFMILDNPFDNLDRQYQKDLRKELVRLGQQVILIQFLSRQEDLLPLIKNTAYLSGHTLEGFPKFTPEVPREKIPQPFSKPLPPAPDTRDSTSETLVDFREVDLSYEGRPILHRVVWRVNRGEFWELRGPNGSGKTSMINMITGDTMTETACNKRRVPEFPAPALRPPAAWAAVPDRPAAALRRGGHRSCRYARRADPGRRRCAGSARR